MSKQPGIYRISVKRGAYIGRSVDVPKRWSAHRSHLRKDTHSNDFLQAAWNNHGPDAFRWSVVHDGRRFLSFWERWHWTKEKLNPFTVVYNEIKPSKSPRRWYMFWRKK